MTMEKKPLKKFEAPELEDQAVLFFEGLQQAADSGLKEIDQTYGGVTLGISLPPLGEGDRGIVYPLRAHSLTLPEARGSLCLKVAKQQPICRERLLEEAMTTEFLPFRTGVRPPNLSPGSFRPLLHQGICGGGIHYQPLSAFQ